MVGSCAAKHYEPRQVGNEAAVSSPLRVPQERLTGATWSGVAVGFPVDGGCTTAAGTYGAMRRNRGVQVRLGDDSHPRSAKPQSIYALLILSSPRTRTRLPKLTCSADRQIKPTATMGTTMVAQRTQE